MMMSLMVSAAAAFNTEPEGPSLHAQAAVDTNADTLSSPSKMVGFRTAVGHVKAFDFPFRMSTWKRQCHMFGMCCSYRAPRAFRKWRCALCLVVFGVAEVALQWPQKVLWLFHVALGALCLNSEGVVI